MKKSKEAITKLNNKVKHAVEVEVQYGDRRGQKFQICRDCRSEKKYHKAGKDAMWIVRSDRPDATIAGCLKRGPGTDSCGHVVARSGMVGSQESESPLLSNAGHAGMETACPICKKRLEAHDDGQMAECGIVLMKRDYGLYSAGDYTWECPECYGDVADHDDVMLANCSRLLILENHDN